MVGVIEASPKPVVAAMRVQPSTTERSPEAVAAKSLQPLGLFRGFAMAGCEPGEMCIGGGQGAAGLFEVL